MISYKKQKQLKWCDWPNLSGLVWGYFEESVAGANREVVNCQRDGVPLMGGVDFHLE